MSAAMRKETAAPVIVKGDELRHHSMPGTYHVEGLLHGHRVRLSDPQSQWHTCWLEYVLANFQPVNGTWER
jgi:hypothetical protein